MQRSNSSSNSSSSSNSNSNSSSSSNSSSNSSSSSSKRIKGYHYFRILHLQEVIQGFLHPIYNLDQGWLTLTNQELEYSSPTYLR